MADIQAYLSEIGDFDSQAMLEKATKSKPVELLGQAGGSALVIKQGKDVVDKLRKGKQAVSDLKDKISDVKDNLTKPKQDFTDMLDEMDEVDEANPADEINAADQAETSFGSGVITTDEGVAQQVSQNAGGTYETMNFQPSEGIEEDTYNLDGTVGDVGDLGALSDALDTTKTMVTGLASDASDAISGGLLAGEGVIDAIPVIGEIAAPFLALATIGTEIGEALDPGSKPSGPQLQSDV